MKFKFDSTKNIQQERKEPKKFNCAVVDDVGLYVHIRHTDRLLRFPHRRTRRSVKKVRSCAIRFQIQNLLSLGEEIHDSSCTVRNWSNGRTNKLGEFWELMQGLQLPSEQIEETVVVAHKADLRKNKNEN